MWALGTIFFTLHSRGLRFNVRYKKYLLLYDCLIWQAESESLISFLQDLKGEVQKIPAEEEEVSKVEMNKVYRVLEEGILKDDPEKRLSSKKVAEILRG